MQRILSTKNPREASLMSAMVNVVLNLPRYFMITGLTILALVFYSDKIRAMGKPWILRWCCPMRSASSFRPGCWACWWPGLLAAFMSNFAATVNAAPPYIVNDIYRKYINPQRQRTNLCAAELPGFVRRGGAGHHLRLVCDLHQYGDPVDRLGACGAAIPRPTF